MEYIGKNAGMYHTNERFFKWRGGIYLRMEIFNAGRRYCGYVWMKMMEYGKWKVIQSIDENLKLEVAFFARSREEEPEKFLDTTERVEYMKEEFFECLAMNL